MSEYNFEKVKDVVEYVKPKVDYYRQFTSKKEIVIDELKIVFSTDSPFLHIVVKDGKFAETFFKEMGKGRMKALKKLLYELEYDYYRQINFRDE